MRKILFIFLLLFAASAQAQVNLVRHGGTSDTTLNGLLIGKGQKPVVGIAFPNDGTKFLSGDTTWKVVSGGGGDSDYVDYANSVNFTHGSGQRNLTILNPSGQARNGSGDLVAIGIGAFTSVDSLDNEGTAVGSHALNKMKHNASGGNTAVGYYALSSLTSNGGVNTAIGTTALNQLTNGSNNTALGFNALNSLKTGSGNTVIGSSAMSFGSDTNNTATVMVGANPLGTTNGIAFDTCIILGFNGDGQFLSGTRYKHKLILSGVDSIFYTPNGNQTATPVKLALPTTSGTIALVGGGGSGTVTSVALSLPAMFTVSGSPVTTSGTLTATLASQSQNLVFASPNGSSGAPTFRALVSADIPDIGATYLKVANNLSDLASANTARTNLGLGTSATHASTDYFLVANNLSEGTAATMRTNLGLGSLAVLSSVDLSGSGATGTLAGARFPALTGDATNSAGSLSTTVVAIQNKAISLATGYLKYTGSAWAFDNSTFLTGNQTITLSGDVSGSGATAIATTIGANKVTTSTINNSAVTLAKIANSAANSVLVGSGAAGTGTAYSEIALGSGLSMTGTTLSATGSGGSVTSVDVAIGGLSSSGAITTSGTITMTGALNVNRGGTGAATLASNGILYGNGTSAVNALAVNATGTNKFLTQSSSAAPAWAALVSGDIPNNGANTTGSAAKWTTARNLAGNSVDGSANVAFANAFIVQGTADAGLTGAQFLGSLATGIVKNTTTTGVLSIAVAGDFPTLNQNTTGSAATLTTPRTINGTSFDGSANITVTAAAGTLTGTTLNSTVVTSSLTTVGTLASPTLTTPVINGLATGTGVASGATVSTLAARDANGSLSGVNWLADYTTTATAAGTTTLTVGSTFIQNFTGTTTQTVVLPVASTLTLGQQYQINNLSTGAVTIQSSGANNIVVLAAGTSATLTAILTSGTTAASWNAGYNGGIYTSGKSLSLNNTLTLAGTDGTTMTFPSTSATIARTDAANTFTGVQTMTSPNFTTPVLGTPSSGNLANCTGYVGTSALVTLGTVTTGTWNGSVLTEAYGGTNQSTYTTGDILYASGTNTLSKLAIGTTNKVLTVIAGVPSWQAAAGGGMTNPMTTTGDIIYSSDNSGTPARLAVGTVAQFLIGGTTPSWSNTLLNAGIATTYTNGLILTNTTASTSGTKTQQSPSLKFLAHVWSQTATAADSTSAWDITNVPVTSTNPIISNLTFRAGNGGTNMNEVFGITSAGGLRINGSLLGGSGGIVCVNGSGILTIYQNGAVGRIMYGSNGTVTNGINSASTFFFDQNNTRLGIGGGISDAATYTLHAYLSDAATSAISTVVGIDHKTSGTPAAGYGSQILMLGQSSTTASQNMGAIAWDWVTATHASRASEMTFWGVFNAGSLTKIATINQTSATAMTLGLGVNGTTLGQLALSGNTSGGITIQPSAAAGSSVYKIQDAGGNSNFVTEIGSGGAATCGKATLTSGTVTVSTTSVKTGSIIMLTDVTTGALTNVGSLTVGTIVDGTSFVINSTNVLDGSSCYWFFVSNP